MGCICGKPSAIEDNKESPRERVSSKTASTSVSRREEGSYWGRDRCRSSNGKGRAMLIEKKMVSHSAAGSVPRASEGEQVAAGWPSWLAFVTGDAVTGWVPRRADSFEKLDKVCSFPVYSFFFCA